MKRVLIIAYYWPPSAGSGVQRWLKFSKYLPQYGWQPVIYTPENPDFSVIDADLLSEVPIDVEVIKHPIWEPYSFGRRLFGKKKDKGTSAGIVNDETVKGKLLNWIRGNVFIPDPKVFWRKPSVKFLKAYLAKKPVDVIVSTGTPHSMHLIAFDLKKELNLPWIADFRDPWSELDMLKSYNILPPLMGIYRKMEQRVVENANLCTITSKVWAEDLRRLGAKRVEVLTNGFDETDFNVEVQPYKDFVISHFGLLNHLRNPHNFWKALAELCKENKEFSQKLKLHFGGTIDQSILSEIKNFPELEKKIKVFPYLSHKEVVKEYLKSSVLLLLLFNSKSGKGNIPGKFFEYLASKKPIIAFGAGDGDVKEILDMEDHSRFNLYNSSIDILKQDLTDLFQKQVASINPNFSNYSRKALTKRLTLLMEGIVGN